MVKVRACLFGLILVARSHLYFATTTTATTCLPNAVAPGNRKLIIIDGQEVPLGVWSLNWASSRLVAQVFKTLVEEELGYNISTLNLDGNTYNGLWAMVGCAEGGTVNGPVEGCIPDKENVQSTTHLLVESWDYYLPTIMARIADEFPLRLPKKLGSVGYDGIEAYYVKGQIVQQALEQDGVGLDIYRSYNVSWYEPSRYFDSVESVDSYVRNATEKGWQPCHEYAAMTDADALQSYVDLFGDNSGVETVDDTLQGKCVDGTWWVSPACRGNLNLCVPLLTNSGWGVAALMHKVTAYNMPIAIASVKGWTDWINTVRSTKTLTFWWVPDTSFIDLDMRQLMFPRYNRAEYQAGNYRTDALAVKLEKWAHPGLEAASPIIYQTATNMQISMDSMTSMLIQLKEQGTIPEVACKFLRTNEYKSWIPSPTACFVGQGLINGTCKWCPPATLSAKHPNISDSRECVPCPGGRHQSTQGQTECVICEAGKSALPGQSSCMFCERGKYASFEEQSTCDSCPTDSTTDNIAEVNVSACTCDLGFYGPANSCVSCPQGSTTASIGSPSIDQCTCKPTTFMKDQLCVPCLAGMTCLDGSAKLSPGFYSEEPHPLSVYRCADTDTCPGGEIGSCLGDRIGLACEHCPTGKAKSEEGCKICTGSQELTFVGVFLIAIIALGVVHAVLNRPLVLANRNSMSGGFLCGMAVTSALTMNIYATLDSIWLKPLQGFFDGMKLITLDPKVIGFSCVSQTTNTLPRYIFKLMGVPLAVFTLTIGAGMLHLNPFTRKYARFNLTDLCNSVGLLFSVFFIQVSLVSIEGLNCLEHPNGRSSLVLDLSMICWEGGDHSGMVAASILAILAYPFSFLAFTGFLTWKYAELARRYGHSFTLRTRFLVNRFTPEFYFFGFFYNVRNFSLTIVPVLLSVAAGNLYGVKVSILMLVFVVWLVLQMQFRPWRFDILNVFDTFTTAAQILLLNMFTWVHTSTNHATEKATPETIGWIIVVIFVSVTLILVVSGMSKVSLKFVGTKRYGIFIAHYFSSIGAYARYLKMMLQEASETRVFLDVDEVENLDNIAFTVRTDTHNLVILATKETLSNLYCAMEIVSAHVNGVPMMLIEIAHDTLEMLKEDSVIKLTHRWTDWQWILFSKSGMSMSDVHIAYKGLEARPRFKLPFDGSEDAQRAAIKSILNAAVGCQLSWKSYDVDPEQIVYVCYDTHTSVSCCNARILQNLFGRARWTCKLLSDRGQFAGETQAVAVVLISFGLHSNPISLGHLIHMKRCALPFVPVTCQEEFMKRKSLQEIASARKTNFDPMDLKVIKGAAALKVVTDLYEVIAWPFEPQHAASAMYVAFQAILARVHLEQNSPRDLTAAELLDDIEVPLELNDKLVNEIQNADDQFHVDMCVPRETYFRPKEKASLETSMLRR